MFDDPQLHDTVDFDVDIKFTVEMFNRLLYVANKSCGNTMPETLNSLCQELLEKDLIGLETAWKESEE